MTASDIGIVAFIHIDLCSRGGILVQRTHNSEVNKCMVHKFTDKLCRMDLKVCYTKHAELISALLTVSFAHCE